MRILVTGAGGFVGGHLVPALTRAGHEVVAASQRPLTAPGCLGVEIFDIVDTHRISELVERYSPHAVAHLAAQPSVRLSWIDPATTYRTNIEGATSLLEALKSKPTERVLLVGSAQVFGSSRYDRPLREDDPIDPVSPYAISKAVQELIGRLYHREFGMPIVMTRSFNHTGPGQTSEYAVGAFCSQIVAIEQGRQEPRLEVGNLDSRRDFLDVRDVVQAYRLLVESGRPGEVYNVSSGEAMRVGDVLEILLDQAGLSSTVEVAEAPASRAGDPEALVGDNSKIAREVGWKPEIPLEQSLFDTLEWYRQHLPGDPGSQFRMDLPRRES